MGKRETKVGKKKIIHKKGFIDKGILWNEQVYPVFSDNQTAKSWNILSSLKSKNIKKVDYEALIAVITNARTTREAEEGYIALNRARGIPMEVSVLALELANNRLAREFIITSNEVLDFNQVSRNKVTINVLDGNQDSTPVIEEVSGQGLRRSKKKPKIEEPGDDEPKKEELNEIVESIKKKDVEKTAGYFKDLVKFIRSSGVELVANTAINLASGALILKNIIDTGRYLFNPFRFGQEANPLRHPLNRAWFDNPNAVFLDFNRDILPILTAQGGQSFYKKVVDEVLKVEDKKEKDEDIKEKDEVKQIIDITQEKISLGEKLGKGKSTGFTGAGNIDLETMSKIRAKNVKKYMDMKGYKSTGDLTQEDIDKLFPGKARERKLKEEADKIEKEAEEIEKEAEKLEKQSANIRMTISEKTPTPPAPPAPPAKQTETAGEVSQQIQEKLSEQEGTAGYSFKEQKEGLDLDDEEDTGLHNESIQRISTMNDYDFTFTKKSLLAINPLPNDPKMLRKMGEKCIREYGYLLGILEPKDNYSKKEVEELYTLKHILKQVIRLESQYKKSILKMRVASGSNQLEKLMNRGQLGLVMNAGSMNVSPQEAVSQMSSSPLKPQTPAQATAVPQASAPINIPKTNNKKKRMDLLNQRKRKAVLRQPKNIVLRGRIVDPPDYQNLRTEAERLNMNPIPLVFKSNNRMNQMRRFNVGY
mgnify:FL=1